MEASTLSHASRSGLLARRSPLLRLQGDERLVALIRAGHDRAFEVLFDRYHARLLAFCRHMLRSAEDAEDVLQEVFANAHAAMLADARHINVRPWLYRIARNRCLNHLRKPVAESQDSMDVHPHEGGATTAERVQTREDFRALVADVQDLPETQRTALLLREIDALSYEDIASAMDTTVPAVKSLLVRSRMSLAEASQSRLLTCGDVRLELAEAAEGLRKASGPVRHHLRSCEPCREYRSELRANGRALASLAPVGLLVWLQALLGTKLFGLGSGSGAGGSAAATGAGAAACGSGVAAGGGASAGGAAGGAALGGAAAAAGGAAGGVSGALGAKAAAGLATAALLTAGAVEVKHLTSSQRDGANTTPAAQQVTAPQHVLSPAGGAPAVDRVRSEQRRHGGERNAGAAAVAAETEAKAEGKTEASTATTPSQEAPPAPAGGTEETSTSGGIAGPASGGSGSGLTEAGASAGATPTDEEPADAEHEGEPSEDEAASNDPAPEKLPAGKRPDNDGTALTL
jgi:RNA polymerase sigma factor (sigma-70 family)